MGVPKRVSVKGRGADLFFSEAAGGEVAGSGFEHQDDHVLEIAKQPDGEPDSKLASQLASYQANKQTGAGRVARPPKRRSEEKGSQPTSAGSPYEIAVKRISRPGIVAGAFRFSPDEIEGLDDLVYQVKKRYGVRVLKQDIVRLALAYLASQYEELGEESVLGRYVKNRKESEEKAYS